MVSNNSEAWFKRLTEILMKETYLDKSRPIVYTVENQRNEIPLMAVSHIFRIDFTRAFKVTGVEYFGPFSV